jgi:hypothetical protein
MMPTTIPTPALQLGSALAGAASLLAAAALVGAVDEDAAVSVTVSAGEISVQVSQHAGPAKRRTAAVAAYARMLHTEVVHRGRHGSPDTWVETRGRIGAHPVHVWTLAHGREREA